jgi:hypothetical protein
LHRAGLWRWAAAFFTTALCAPAVAGASAPPPIPELPIPVHVTFTGSGSFNYDNTEIGHAHADDELSWHVEYQSVLLPGGTLGPSSATPEPTAGKYFYDDDFYGVNCNGTISTIPKIVPPGTPDAPPETTPRPTAEGSLVQSITYLSTDPVNYSGCKGTVIEYEAEGEAASGVAEVLNNYLPGALTAQIIPMPRSTFLAAGVASWVQPVSSSSALEPVPYSCAPLFGINDPSKCTATLTWSGVVILDATAGCPVILADPAPACMPTSGTPLSSFTGGVDADATGPGTASVTATAVLAHGASAGAAKSVVIATASAKTTRAGKVRLRPRITPAGRRALAHSHRLKVSVQVVFKPRSGAATTARYATVLTHR